MNSKQIRWRNRIIIAIILFAIAFAIELSGILEQTFGQPQAVYIEFAMFLIPYLIGGYDVIIEAFQKLARGHGLDESFLMTIATFGAFALVLFPDSEPHMAEGAAVMLFYQVGELFQSYAVGKSRKSISDLMDIAPEFANIMQDGKIVEVDPYEVEVGQTIIVRPGERIPLDGVVQSGESRIDTSALTGESALRSARAGDEVISGCVNQSGTLEVKVTQAYENSTVSRILELVENAADKKAKTENFISRFARYYTPIVVGLAASIAILPPLFMTFAGAGAEVWQDWVFRGLTFLVVSCPCALVISVPLSFFGGIGGASRRGILVKGSNYLEALAKVDTVVFDKTGTLTSGTFAVTDIKTHNGISEQELLEIAAHAESRSTHPIAASILAEFEERGGRLDATRITNAEETGGHGISAQLDGAIVLVGNSKLMYMHDINYEAAEFAGTNVHIARDGQYIGTITIGDAIKADSAQAISELHKAGVKNCIMLTGDSEKVASQVATKLGLDAYYAELLPQNKVEILEEILDSKAGGEAKVSKAGGISEAGKPNVQTASEPRKRQAPASKVAFVGDGINDAPVLTRADVGIAMGAMGSDAAIEAADVVLMDDKPTSIAQAMKIARKTMRIVWQNIIFALGIKFAVLILAAFGIANMWMAVFADVGVAIIAILNAMRAMRN